MPDSHPPPPAAAPAVLVIVGSRIGNKGFPIEAGYALPDGQSHCRLIRPTPDWSGWDADAERLHRIPLPTLYLNGVEPREVAAQLNAHLQGLTVYCDGWAASSAALGMLFEAAGLAPTFGLADLRGLLGARELAFWDVVKTQVATEMRLQRHRASSDAKVLQHTLLRLRAPLPAGPSA